MRLDWRVVRLDGMVGMITGRQGAASPRMIAVDGHSSSGKSTLARRLATVLPGTGLLHTDDLAWHQGVFSWDRLMRDEVLPVVRAGAEVDYRPPQWRARGRTGSIRLPGPLDHLVVEGVGASQPSLRDGYDVVIWVETEEPTRLARDVPRLAAGEISAQGYVDWMAEENAYTTVERPWEHADLLLYGGESIGYDPGTEVVVAEALGRSGGESGAQRGADA